jgi:hypothetical protein
VALLIQTGPSVSGVWTTTSLTLQAQANTLPPSGGDNGGHH